jgi:hypothetical protein
MENARRDSGGYFVAKIEKRLVVYAGKTHIIYTGFRIARVPIATA